MSDGMYDDADIENYAERLRSSDSATRDLAADESADGVSAWGHHSYTEPQAHRITEALVDALIVETEDKVRESILNALSTFVAWDLAPSDQVSRAIATRRPASGPIEEFWTVIEEWASRHDTSD